MKKRILSALTALALALTLLPTGVLALAPSPEAEQEDLPIPTSEAEPEPGLAFEADSTVPEFVPGVVPEEYELVYPNYDLFPAVYNLEPSYTSPYQTSVKNQGSNGLCWTFGAYAALEAQAKKTLGIELDFSELHMAYSTSDHSGNTLQGFDRAPGDGGNRSYAAAYLMRGTALSGTVNESEDLYSTKAIGDRPLSESENKTQTYTAQNILFLNGTEKITNDEAGRNMIKEIIREYGGVGASMYWDGQTTATDGAENQKYYNAATNSYYLSDAVTGKNSKGESYLRTNHLVEIAGWDDEYPKENFNT